MVATEAVTVCLTGTIRGSRLRHAQTSVGVTPESRLISLELKNNDHNFLFATLSVVPAYARITVTIYRALQVVVLLPRINLLFIRL